MLGKVRGMLLLAGAAVAAMLVGLTLWPQAAGATGADIVFVARAHLATQDDVFQDEVGPAGQFGTGLPKFAPGSKLMLRKSDGTLVTLVDGANPGPATGNLIDVQSPDVSFDGSRIIFAGATTTDPGLLAYGWRLYEINVNGSGFRRVAVADRSFTDVPRGGFYDFGNQDTYGWWNDLFPAYLADGRIVFSSTRYPSRSEYDERHTYNLYVMNGDGTGVHRISSERGGLLHPTPLPDGRILVSRWWNNFNMPSDTGIYNRIDNRPYNQTLPDGTLIYSNTATFDPADGRLPGGAAITHQPNTWHLMTISPDGSQFGRYAFTPYSQYDATDDDGRDTYTAAQPAVILSGTQTYVAFTSQQDSTMVHSTQKTGIRVAQPGAPLMYANFSDAIAGLTYAKAWNQNDDSPPYALHPWGMPDGTILFSYAITNDLSLPTAGVFADPGGGGLTQTLQGSQLQYALYTMNLDGSNKQPLASAIGSADAMDAKPVVARSGWQSLPDAFSAQALDDPRYWNLPNTVPAYHYTLNSTATIQTATLHNPNVYANPPLELPYINNSPMPGSVASAQVYVDADQFTGAYCYDNYPDPCTTFKMDSQVRAILWTQAPVSARGEFTATIPADVPGFVVLRDANGRAVSGWNRGYVSIAQGSAWARPGQTVTCIGCHLGHMSGSLTAVSGDALQGLTNIAPYAAVSASSTYSATGNPFAASRLNDRRGWVPAAGAPGVYADDTLGWISAAGAANATGATITLTWPVPLTITRVRLVGPPPTGGDWGGFGDYSSPAPYHVTAGTLRLYRGANPVGGALSVGQVEPLASGGTTVGLASPALIDRLTFTVNGTSGKWFYKDVAALQEIEVIGMSGTAPAVVLPRSLFVPLLRR